MANRDLEADRLIIEAEFSREFYIAQFASGLDIVDPIRHYLEIGWREYRDPSPSFSTSFYLTEYPDVSQAEINPFVHYIISGRNEGRFASPKDPQRLESQYKYEISIISEYFDQDFYVEQEPSLKDQTRLAMLRHFVEHGWRNHRDPSPDFSTKRYLQLYEDVVTKNVNPFFHYIVAGKSEGRLSPVSERKPRYVDLDKLRPVSHDQEKVRRAPPITVPCRGKLELVRGTAVIGWAVSPDKSRHCGVDILWDDILFVTINASVNRDDLIRKGIVRSGGGFRYTFTNSPGESGTGTVRALITGTDVQLDGNPVTLQVPPISRANTFFSEVTSEAKDMPVSIIIPIWNAADDLILCLQSVESFTTSPARLILIDDCSPDPRINEILQEWEGRSHVQVIRNSTNLGFSGSINAGIISAGRSDVILLNSDTIVTCRWLEKLRQAAYSGRGIATVTPLSNNAGAFSVPNIGTNIVASWLDTDAMARIVAHASGTLYPEVPTGNGFCLYIRRDCLDDVGLLDADAFPRGYGEENDFCMRALRRGFRNIVDDLTYVYHKRSASFGEIKTELYDRGRLVVTERYPEYDRLTSVFSVGSAFLSIRWRIRKALHEFEARVVVPLPRILFVISTQSGGTPQTNRDLMGELGDRYETWLLRCDSKDIELSHYKDGESNVIKTFSLTRPLVMSVHRSDEYDKVIGFVLSSYTFELVHIRHIAWHSLGLVSECNARGIPIVLSFHDFYLVCPTVKLLDDTMTFCKGHCTGTNGECHAELWPANDIPPLKHRFIHQWQAKMNGIIACCDTLVTTSPYAAELLCDIFPAAEAKGMEVIPHGRSFAAMEWSSVIPGVDELLRILVPGNISVAKGSRICQALLELPSRREIEFHVLGDPGDLKAQPGIVLHGRYKREEFCEKVRNLRIHVGVIFSIWPETYCHTLTEMWASGIPVIAIDLGAVGERIRKHGGGWLVSPSATAKEIGALLRQIRRGQADYAEKRNELLRWQATFGKLETTGTMASRYDVLYRNTWRNRRFLKNTSGHDDPKIVAVVSQFTPGRHAPASAHIRIGEMTSNRASRPLIFTHLSSHAALSPELPLSLAAVLVQRDTIDPEDVPDFIEICHRRNIKIIIDLDDDLLSVPPDKDLDGRYRGGRTALLMLLRGATLVTVSTQFLAETFSSYSSRVRLVPNMLSARLWGGALSRELNVSTTGSVTALYMGTTTHDADLQLLREPIRKIRERYPDFRLLVIGGQRENEDWFTRLDGHNTPRNYPEFVSWFRKECLQVDFALGPLADTVFNRSKSDLKFLDYSAAGLAGVYSNVPSYSSTVIDGDTGMLVNNDTKSWHEAIDWMICNPDRRAPMAERARKFVIEERVSLNPGLRLEAVINEVLQSNYVTVSDDEGSGRLSENRVIIVDKITHAGAS